MSKTPKTKIDATLRKIPYVQQIAILKKEQIVSVDSAPSLALHEYMMIPKGEKVGLIDRVDDKAIITECYYFGSAKVKAYVANNNLYHIVYLRIEDIEVIEEIEEEVEEEVEL